MFIAASPVRILDTRDGTGGTTGPIAQGGTFQLQVTGVAEVPADATSVVMNVTATEGTGRSFITVWPAGQPRPNASNLNTTPDQNVPNLVTVALGAGGRLSFFNAAGTINLIADIAGYYVDHNHDDRCYSKAEVDAKFAQLDTKFAQFDARYAPADHLAWAKFQSPGGGSEDYIVTRAEGATFTLARTGVGVYAVTVSGYTADGARNAILLTPEQGQTTVFRALQGVQAEQRGRPGRHPRGSGSLLRRERRFGGHAVQHPRSQTVKINAVRVRGDCPEGPRPPFHRRPFIGGHEDVEFDVTSVESTGGLTAVRG